LFRSLTALLFSRFHRHGATNAALMRRKMRAMSAAVNASHLTESLAQIFSHDNAPKI
jgi:hypothetical protein